MKSKKAQAAMEFLMTYGWALLVVLIAIAALAFFGLLNPQRFLPEKCELGSGLTCLEFAAEVGQSPTNSNITIIFNNGIGQPVYNMYINLSVCGTTGLNSSGGAAVAGNAGASCAPGNYSNGANCQGAAIIPSLSEGATARVYFNCSSSLLGTQNSRFKSDILVNYSTVTEGQALSHTKKGFIVVAIQ
jgi:hypothetical protein